MFGSSEMSVYLVLLALLFFISFLLFFLKRMNFYAISTFFSLPFFFCVFLIIYSNGNIGYPDYYFIPFYILLPIFLLSVWSRLRYKWKLFLAFSFLVPVIFLSFIKFTQIKATSNLEMIDNYQLIAKSIADDITKTHLAPNDLIIFTIDDQLDWSSSLYWFYLENYLGLPLVETTKYRYNVIAKTKQSQNLYLICANPRVSWDSGVENLCLERFDRKDFLQNKEEIMRVDAKNLTIYRLTLKKAISPYLIYLESRIK